MKMCTEIEPGLYLGNRADSENIELLKNLQITRIISMSDWIIPHDLLHQYNANGINHIRFFVSDMPQQDLKSAVRNIHQLLSIKENTLVHCYEGKSRSATAVLYHLMKKNKVPMEVLLSKLKIMRPVVNPNPTFLKLLKDESTPLLK